MLLKMTTPVYLFLTLDTECLTRNAASVYFLLALFIFL